MTNFTSVGTGAARLQGISPNPQKLAGQCAKLKCCLNYEVPVYEDARRRGITLGTHVQPEEVEQDLGFQNAVGEGDVSRFDRKKKNNRNHNNQRRNNNDRNKNNRPDHRG